MDLNRLNPIFESRLKIRQLTAHKIQVTQGKLRFIAKMDGPVVCYLNKYIINSINSKVPIEARYVKLALNMDWPGERYNFLEFWVCSANKQLLKDL